ncbi:uncharacterized protein G2W53_023724 [Senna tora]|uniref:Uncharacterized protein n=1 Tax=Senna tora TaxID=362788 RepID=A0A834WIG9_9FABA|nr:uncharacterized protein G2W53_023724 [Senna tora]
MTKSLVHVGAFLIRTGLSNSRIRFTGKMKG